MDFETVINNLKKGYAYYKRIKKEIKDEEDQIREQKSEEERVRLEAAQKVIFENVFQ